MSLRKEALSLIHRRIASIEATCSVKRAVGYSCVSMKGRAPAEVASQPSVFRILFDGRLCRAEPLPADGAHQGPDQRRDDDDERQGHDGIAILREPDRQAAADGNAEDEQQLHAAMLTRAAISSKKRLSMRLIFGFRPLLA